jgi:hypothetical protein
MTTVGQIEKKTQQRIVKLFRDQLGYDYLGDWIDRENNRNVEPAQLRTFLKRQGHDESLISRTLHLLDKAAGDQSKKLYDRNKEVYDLLRYDAARINEISRQFNHVPIIDKNARGKEIIPMAPHEAERYKRRSAAERANSRLKEDFGADNAMVRGATKVTMHLMFGVITLFADQLIRLLGYTLKPLPPATESCLPLPAQISAVHDQGEASPRY